MTFITVQLVINRRGYGPQTDIEQDTILDAAERVVARDGVANLRLHAVAKEAGISKAAVLYDAKTKQALLEAVVQRAFARDNAQHARAEMDVEGENVAGYVSIGRAQPERRSHA